MFSWYSLAVETGKLDASLSTIGIHMPHLSALLSYQLSAFELESFEWGIIS
jgi:hypothetical protein